MERRVSKKPGPKPRHTAPRKEYHLKFAPDLVAHIERTALAQGYQAYFDDLVRRDMEEKRG